MKIVLDTDVIVAAMRSPSGASAAILLAALDGEVEICANVALMIEYEAVCLREEHVAAAQLTAKKVQMFLDAIAAIVIPVPSHFLWRPQLRDPCDEMVLEAAVNGGAQAIVSFNIKDFGIAPMQFGLRVALPRDALAQIRKLKGKSHD
jgi:putative PIN family toxin of toxin-antitoxin system